MQALSASNQVRLHDSGSYRAGEERGEGHSVGAAGGEGGEE